MAKKTLTEAFEVKPKVSSLKSDVKDYDIFADKNLLEELRIKIVQNLIEENIPDDKLYIGWYSYDSFLTMIDRVNTFENDDKVIPVIDSFSNYLILGFSYQETVKIREILYHRMIKRLPKQIEKTILDREQN